MTDRERETARYAELASLVYTRGRAGFTDFLGMAELDNFLSSTAQYGGVPYTLSGGAPVCERVMARFGDEESLGYPPPDFPIVCLRAVPVAPKFAEPLSHRDCLGALMNLGVRREMLGDIFPLEKEVYLFCHARMADFLCENWTRVRHTEIRAEQAECPALLAAPTLTEEELTLSSERLDGILAHAFGLARTEAQTEIRTGRVFRNGRLATDPTVMCRAGDILTLRGKGRLRYDGVRGVTRKEKLRVGIARY